MKKTFLTIVILCITIVFVVAQTYKGTVKDTKGEAIPFANIVLFSLPDSTFVTGTTTEENGQFLLESKKVTNGYLEISSIGYTTVNCIAKQNIGTIVLKENINELGEVTISASRIKRNAGGYKINLKGEKTAKGKKASELLPFLPGITKQDKSLKVFGRDVGIIYLNGVKIKDAKELESIPAELLSSAQIDYMAGSNESASIKGAVIRIELNKKKENGYYGSLGGGITQMPKYGLAGDNAFSVINYKYNNLSIYNNLSYSDKEAIGDFEKSKLFKNSKRGIFSTEEYRNKEHNFYDRLSLTYDLNKNNELGLSLFTSINNGNPTNKVESKEIFDNITTPYKSETETPYKYRLFQGTANYKYKINKQGSEVKLTADYLHNREKDNTKMQIISTPQNLPLKSNSSDITDMIELDAQLNWVFKSNNKLKTGITFKSIHTDYDRLDLLDMKEVSKLSGTMPSIYSNFSGRKNMLDYEIGLRVQRNTIKYSTQGIDKVNKHSDLDVYPSLNLMYMLNPKKGHMIMMSYKRSVDDIPYSAISPYQKYYSEYYYSIGNPDLISPKNNLLMIAINLFKKITVSGIYMYSKNPIYFETLVDNSNSKISYTMPKNGDYESLLGVHLEGRFNPTEWWRFKASGTYTLYSVKNSSFEMKNQAKYNFSVNNDFTISETAGATLRLFCEPTYDFGNRVFHKVYDADMTVYKKFFDDNLQISIKSKLFRQGRFLDTDTKQIFLKSNNITDERYIDFSITYFFNGGKKVNVKRTNGIQNYDKIKDVI